MLAPRHLRNVDQTLNTGLDLNECTVVGNHNYLTLHVVAHLEVSIQSIPRMRSELLQTEGDATLLVVEVEDNHVDLLVELDHLVGIVYAAPRQVCDVDESVNTTEVNEYTVRGDILNGTLKDLTLLELTDDLLLLGLELLLDESLMRNNDIAELLVDLDYLELHGLAYELIVVAYGVNVDLRAGEECLDTEHVNDHTALRATLDEALDDCIRLESLINLIPRLRHASLLVREDQLTLLVFSALYVNLYQVADLQVGIVAELRSGDNTVALVADVDNNFLLVNRDDLTFNYLVVGYFVKGFVVRLVKFFLANTSGRTILELIPIEIVERLNVLC